MPSAYFELALREFGCSAEAEAALREGTGVTSGEPGCEITLGQQLRQVRNINRLQPPGWGLRLGSRFEAATHGPVGFAALSAPTLATAVSVIERFGHVRSPYFRLTSRGDDGRFLLRVDERVRLAEEERVPLLETLMASLQRLIETILGRPLREAYFDFAWSPPAYAERYADYFPGRVRFDATDTELAIPLSWLWVKCPTADPVAFAASLRTLETLERRLEGQDHLVARVDHLIAASGQCPPTLEQLAKRVHMSTRTVIRHLRRAGTTYQDVVDAHRREQAQALLGTRDLDIAEVGYCLGYQDPASFGRACRRWFGMAPSRYRVHLLDS
jgi:AraC-like DNA-binding protein